MEKHNLLEKLKKEIKKHKLVILKLTTQCNMSCRYCYQHQNGKVDLSNVYSDNVMDLIINDIHNFRDDSTDLSIIGGEVSIFSEKIKKMIDKIRDSGLTFNSLCIVSNGSFDDAFIDMLETLDLSFIRHKPRIVISIDANEKLHNMFRAHNGVGEYSYVKNNINKLAERVSDKFNILTSTVIDFSSINSIEEINLNDKDLNVNFIHRNLIPVYKIEFSKHDFELHKKLCEKIGDSIIKLLESDDLLESDIIYSLQGLDIFHLRDILFENIAGKRTCDIGYLKSYLPNGDMTSCHQQIDIKEDMKYSFGSLIDKNVSDYSKPISEFVQMTSPCIKCKYNGLCQGACLRLDGKNQCIPWRRAQSVNMFETWKRILSIDDFYNKYVKFIKRANSKMNNNYLFIENFFKIYESLIKEEIKKRYNIDL